MENVNQRQNERVRSRSEERAERRTMDLLLVASATNNRELAATVCVGRQLKVFKVPDETFELSPEFPLTLKIADISQLLR